MKKCILLVWVVLSSGFILGQISTDKTNQSDWRDTFQFLSPQPNSQYHNITTRIALRTGQELNVDQLEYAVEGVQIIGDESGNHEYGVVLTRDKKTVNLIPKVPFDLGETVTVTIESGILLPSGESLQFSWSFETSEKLPDAWTAQAEEVEIKQDRDYTPPEVLVGPEPGISEGNFFVNITSGDSWMAILNEIASPGTLYLLDAGLKGNDFKVNRNGLPTYYDRSDFSWRIMNSMAQEIETVYMLNGYTADNHDFQVLPNWNKFLFAYDDQIIDMSEIVFGGDPNAMVEGFVIQEHDAEGNLILQWRSWDYFEITDNNIFDLTWSDLNLFHINSIEVDTDDNLIFGCRHTNEITKINRETGAIIWRWGGSQNMFTLASNNAEFSYQHDARRLQNGHILVFDNNNLNNQISRSVEYILDEENFTVGIAWEYAHPEELFGASMGGNQRLENGNTVIYWGNVGLDAYGARVTEVTMDHEIVLEFAYPLQDNSYRVPKHDFTFGEVEEGCGDPEAVNYDQNTVASNINLCLYDVDGDGFAEDVDCNDDDDTIYPGADEIADDGVDQDCNGYDLSSDDADLDEDGISAAEGDCNDNDDTIYPGAEEIPYDGIDQDCDGVDLTDVDQDGVSLADGDCNDNDDTIYPGAEEVPYDGIDQDCNGEDLDDLDNDGFSPEDGDCNDEDENINPDAEEIPYDGIDQDCSGADLDDLDEDGFSPADGDCNDEDETINPDAEEIPNDGIDQDCDGADLIVSVSELEEYGFLFTTSTDHVNIIGLPGESFDLVIHDLQGQLVSADRTTETIQIDTSIWSPGVYTFSCISSTHSRTFKLFID